MTRALITGGTGFIGSRLALHCRNAGQDVLVLGQANTAAEEDNRNLLVREGIEVDLVSMADRDRLADRVKGRDVVYHLAAAQHEANVPDQHFRDVNVEGTRRLLDVCVESGVRRFVHGSTIGVYGSKEGVIDETTSPAPDNIYGVTKLEGERLVLSYGDRLPVVAIRISETYGPGDRRLLKLFRAIDKGMFFVIGSGRNLHHLVYIDDLIKGMVRASEAEGAPGEVFLLAGERPLTTREMADTIAAALGKSVPAWRVPLFPFTIAACVLEGVLRPLGIQPPLHRRRLDFFKKSFTLSSDKAGRILGYSAEVDFRTGAAATADWYREHGLL
ncbi:MAG: NAD-dependent epimerase/dehydratase family protein [Arenicellales bacterium]